MKRGAILAPLMLLGGCGFHPMYANGLAPQLASIYVEPVAESDGYELRNALIDLLGSNGEMAGKAYRLTITMKETNQGVALENNATITRYNDRLTAAYTLTDAKGTTLTVGSQIGLSSYNVAASPYSTLAAQQDADKRAAQDMADRIRLDLGAWFRHRKSGHGR
ncbi:MAG TPA: LPS assembly lipoprotein LptE [Rhizomicrobium sp.]|jgi:LPS-assembly lipoprotein|nr:LPS assembly lipoprotein LptE [Rhizomicrobium sp.]